MFFDVVEHIEKDDDFLTLLHTYLKPDGYLFITVPTYEILWSKDDEYAGHYRRYTVKTMNEKLIKNGFSIEYSTYFFSILIFPIFIFRTIPYFVNRKKVQKNIDDFSKEHNSKGGVLDKILNFFLTYELKRIKKG